MLRIAQNNVIIEGILNTVDISEKSYEKNGRKNNALSGSITVKTTQKMNGEDIEVVIPVHIFASELTSKGTQNPAYVSISKVKNEFISIAAGGVENADRIRISGGRINMNTFYNRNGKLVSYPRIEASFFNKVDPQEYNPEATFVVEMLVASKEMEVDKNQVETGRLCIKGVVPMYGGRVEVIPFYCANSNVINAVDNYWQLNDTVRAKGRLLFYTKVDTVIDEDGFGETFDQKVTTTVGDLIITGGSETPYTDMAFDLDEIKQALTERSARINAMKDRPSQTTKAATTKANYSVEDFPGF